MISHDVQSLAENRGRYSTFLTATGKIIADFHFYKLPDRVLLVVAAELADPLQESLEKFVIMDDVQFVRPVPPAAHVSLHGPGSVQLMRELTGGAPPSGGLEVAGLRNLEGWVINRPELAADGFEILLAANSDFDLREWLGRRSVPEIPFPVLEVLRIEAMRPRFGIDMDHDNNPLEARLDDAYSLTKGCYVGQEVVAKATHVGGVNRLLVGLMIEDREVPAPGAPLFAFDHDDQKVGRITSSCFSPSHQAPLALGYVRRRLAEDGRLVRVGSATSSVSARVCLKFSAPGESPQ
jgi:folate-binding protein YgfZ